MPDLLGFGASPRPPAGYGVEDHCDALAACLSELDVDEPAVVAGHSLGSLVSIALAARHPQLVRGVVGFGPPLFRTPADARRRLADLGVPSRLFALPGPVARAACAWMCAHRDVAATLARLWCPSLPAAIARDAVQHSWVSYSETMERVVLGAHVPEWLDDAGSPVALVIGDRDRIADVRLAEQLAADRAGVTLDVWVGADHDLPLTRPTACIAAIRDMVVRTDPGLPPTMM